MVWDSTDTRTAALTIPNWIAIASISREFLEALSNPMRRAAGDLPQDIDTHRESFLH